MVAINRTSLNQHNRNGQLALLAALVCHGGLLLIPLLEHSAPVIERVFTVSLERARPRPSEQTNVEQRRLTQTEKSSPRPVTPRPVPEAISQKTGVGDVSILEIEEFVKKETDDKLAFNRAELDRFEASFNLGTVERKPQQEHFQNAYGETHVISQVGQRQTCYLENNQFTDDDWGFNLVMFYACSKEQEFKLELK